MNLKLRLLSIVLLLSVVLAACATPTPQVVEKQVEKTVVVTQIVKETQPAQVVTATAAPAEATSGTLVIRAGTGDGGDGLTPHQQIIQTYEDKNPSIIVQLEPVSGRDYYARLLTQLAAKAAPDIMQVGDDAVPSFVSKGAFVPLDDYMTATQFDPSIYLPGLLDPGKIDGKQYLLPKDYSPLGGLLQQKALRCGQRALSASRLDLGAAV